MIDRVFALDARALAAFRIAMGVILLFDLWIRSGSILEHYSDQGMFTRKQWIDAGQSSWQWSLHVMNGQPGFIAALFAIAAVAAVALILGRCTRLATFISWLLLASLQQRNEYVNNGADALLRVLLFWSMFLPLGMAWSLDRRRIEATLSTRAREERARSILSVAGVCLILQFIVMYVFSGLFKLNEVWREGDALWRSLSFDLYAKPLGESLREQVAMLRTITLSVPWIEIVLPALCLLPVLTNVWRWLAFLVFLALHIGIELTLTTGLFPWVCMAGWLLLVPGGFWDRIESILRRGPRVKMDAGQPTRAAPPVETSTVQQRSAWGHLVDGGLVFLLVYVVVWNISGLREVETKQPWLDAKHHWLAQVTTLKQRWEMFRDPPTDTGWYVVIGTLADGREMNLLTGEEIEKRDDAIPQRIAAQYPDHRWRKYMAQVASDSYRSHRSRLASALALRWNRQHEEKERITWIELIFMRRTLAPPGEPPSPVKRILMHRAPVLGEGESMHSPPVEGGRE